MEFYIKSKRLFEKWPSWLIVYEWEDILSKSCSLPIKCMHKDNWFEIFLKNLSRFPILHRLIHLFEKYHEPNVINICFEMHPSRYFSKTNRNNTIPIIIDFWKLNSLNTFHNSYKFSKAVLITSYEVYSYLLQNSTPLNIYHFPLSISDKYLLEKSSFLNKKYDIIFAGRRNEVLWNYIKQYESTNPEIEYVYQEQIENELYYKSNKKGLIGKFHSRYDYLNLLKQCKIGIYSTPGIDGGNERTNGFNPVTPRLFEYIISGCIVMGRYPDNEDTKFFKLKELFSSINDYSSFKRSINENLLMNTDKIFEKYNNYIKDHYTSKRANELQSILMNIK